MPALVLSERQQGALRSLLAAEAVPGRPLPASPVLVAISVLVACDAIGAVLADAHGKVLDAVALPRGPDAELAAVGDGGLPLVVGLVHAQHAHRPAAGQVADEVAIGFRNGSDQVVQLFLDRRAGCFTEGDLALLWMITPALGRLMRERPVPRLPAGLTPRERRVLTSVAAGRSNAEIAAELSVAPSTVRKHLEHSFRKLGVGSRLAALAALQGRDLPTQDLRERIERSAPATFA